MAGPILSLETSDLRTAIHGILSPCWRAQAVIDAMLLARGRIGTAELVARRLGLRNRFELAARFKRWGLPPLHELAGWVSVLTWLAQWERTGVSLCALAIEEQRDPAACYRLVQRITGTSWGNVQAGGVAWTLSRFATRCDTLRHRWARPEVSLFVRG